MYFLSEFKKRIKVIAKLMVIITSIFLFPIGTSALEQIQGEVLFTNNCSGCHVNGGNIIRRRKTLKLQDLQRNGIDNPEAIAKIAREGIGIMSGYDEFLGEGEDILVASWIWEQVQKAWVQG